MITLGISGSFERISSPVIDDLPNWFGHDASAALLIDGEIIAAVEQERIDRVKHSYNFPVESIKECLKLAKIRFEEIDKVAFYFEELNTDTGLGLQYLERKKLKVEKFSLNTS
jgi:predicted NodU family carbamoyl transferase